MKSTVKTLVDSIEKEIEKILENAEKQDYGVVKEFYYGSFIYDVSYNSTNNPFLDEWEVNNPNIRIEVTQVFITNENSKTLTNLSNEVFNQLEDNYTNY